jgi:hypothetical protein
MITEDKAIEIACAFLNRQGYDISGQHAEAHLIKRPLVNHPEAAWLKEHKPDVWKTIQESHRDHWSVAFDTNLPPNALPRSFFVRVDAENGEASMTPAL